METTGVMGCVPSVVGLIQAETQRNGPEGGTTNRFAPLNERTVPWYWFGWKSYIRRRMYIYFCFCLKWFEFKLNLIRGLQNSAKNINYFTLQQQSQVPTKVSISLSSFSMIFLLKSNSVSYQQRSTMFIFVSLFWNLYCLQNLKSIW